MILTEEARINEIALKEAESQEQHSVRWQDGAELFSVIKLSVDHVLLNPESHRIRAQIESHPDCDQLEADPFSEAAQLTIAEILRATLEFGKLRDNLNELGQLDPGIVTHSGVLVNGNTRAVALKELGREYIRVAVLPASATSEELTELEARLQLSRDYKQDYTLTNELLFIREQIDRGTSKEDLAILLGKAQSSERRHLDRGVADIERSLRMLQHIREIQEMGQGSIRLTFFDQHESALMEADRAYVALEQRDREEAVRVRNGRMAGVLVGVTYRNLRNWDGDSFLSDHVVPALEDARVQDLVASVNSTDDVVSEEHFDDSSLDVLDADADVDADPSEVELDPNGLLEVVAAAYGLEEQDVVTEDLTRTDLFEIVNECITQAAEEREQERRDEKRSSTPIKLVREAKQKLERAHSALERTLEGGFNRGKLSYEIRQVRKALQVLDQTLTSDA